VADYLVGRYGIDRSVVSTIGRGGSQPIGDNATSIGRSRNRRVVLFIQGNLS
jgi:outer membrane protein OmpA-like peptidoglycan-associated protein